MNPGSESFTDLAVRAYEAFNNRDWPMLQRLFAPDVEVVRAGGMGTLRGSDTVIGFAEPDAFEWQRLEPTGEFIQHDDRLLVALVTRARGKESEIEVEQPVFHVATIRDGRITRLAVYFDRDDALVALHAGD